MSRLSCRPVLALLLVAAGPSAALAQADPVYAGVPLSEWLKDLRGESVALRLNAVNALGQMRLAPEFTAGLLIERLKADRSGQVRARAAQALGGMTPAVKPTVSALAAAAGTRGGDPDPVVRWAALEALNRVAPTALAPRDRTRVLLVHLDPEVARKAWGEWSRDPAAIRELLPDALCDERLARHYLDGQSLDAAGPVDKALGPGVVAALGHASPAVRRLAVDLLRRIGPGVEGAGPALVALVAGPWRGDWNQEVPRAAVEVLSQAYPAALKSPELVKAALLNPRAEWSRGVLAELPRDAAPFRALLPDVLKDEQLARHYLDDHLLDAAGPADKALVPDAVAALRHGSPAVRLAAAGILRRIGPGDDRAGPALAALVAGPRGGDPNPAVRRAALEALLSLDPAALKSRGLAKAALADPDPGVSNTAVSGLSRDAAAARALLPDALQDERLARRCLDGNLSEAVGPGDKALVPDAVAALKHASPAVRLLAIDLLRRIEPAAAVPVLVAMVVDPKGRDPDPAVRVRAAEALGRIGPAAKVAVLSLKAALQSPDPELRWTARLALAGLDPAAATTTATPGTVAELAPLLLPDESEVVSSIGVRSLADFVATRKYGYLDGLKAELKRAWPVLRHFQFDPVTDVNGLTAAGLALNFGAPAQGEFLVILQGKFEQETPGRVVEGEAFGRRVYAVCLTQHLIAVADSREKLGQVQERAAGRLAPGLRPELRRLLARVDVRQTFWLVYDPPEGDRKEIGQRFIPDRADSFRGLTFGVALRDGATIRLQVVTSGGDAPARCQRTLEQYKRLLIDLVTPAAQQPGVTPDLQRQLKEAAEAIRIEPKGDAVIVTLELSGTLLDGLVRAVRGGG